MRKKILKREEGQSMVEFALIIVMLLNLLCVPIELYRFINLRTNLCSAATESLTNLTYEAIRDNGLKEEISSYILDAYGNRFGDYADDGSFITASNADPQKQTYKYYVYSSEKALANGEDAALNPTQEHFEKRNSSYEYSTVELKLSVSYKPVTYLGSMAMIMFGDEIKVQTPTYHAVVFADGFKLAEGGGAP